MSIPEIKESFDVSAKFPPQWNLHYDFSNPGNLEEIEKVEAYAKAFAEGDESFIQQAERKALGGKEGYAKGIKVESPWGDNTVLENSKDESGRDVTIKEITVKPGFMLSLQRHLGREELWEVKSGILTVIADGKRIEVKAGESIKLPPGCVHCMNNAHGEPVTVIETQLGKNREADNVRLVDFNNRPVYPLKTENEFKSARLYAQLHAEIQKKFGCKHAPNPALLAV